MRNLISGGVLISLACLLLCASAGSVKAAVDVNLAASKSYLTLETTGCGFIHSLSGGGPVADVVKEPGGGLYAKKHLGALRYEPIKMECDLRLSSSFYRWIADSWQGNTTRKNGVIAITDNTLTPVNGLQFTNALVTEVTIPACDASVKDGRRLSVILAPETTRDVMPEKPGTTATQNDSAAEWAACNYRLEIDGLDCRMVNKIDAFTIKQAVVADTIGEVRDYANEPGKLEFPNLHITMSERGSDTWKQWANDFLVKGNNDDTRERNGRLVFLSADGQRELARIELSHLGIRALTRAPMAAGGDTIPRMTAELYCERMSLVCDPAATTPNTTANPTTNTTTDPATNTTANPTPQPPTNVTTDGGNPALPTAQAPGDNGEIGKVYAMGTTDPLYFSLLGADFTTGPIVIGEYFYTPKANEKLLVLRFTVQNPQQIARLVRWDTLAFIAVDAFGVNHQGQQWGVAKTRQRAEVELLPAQKLELYTVITVPAKGQVPKLQVQATDSRESPVLRYDLRDKVTPLKAPVADPADATGSTALEKVPAGLETAWPCANFSVTVEKFALVNTALDGEPPAEGERFLVVTMLAKNQAPINSLLRGDTFNPALTTTEGELLKYHGMLLATTNRRVEQAIKPGEEMRVRIYFTLPANTRLKSLAISEGESRTYLFQVRP